MTNVISQTAEKTADHANQVSLAFHGGAGTVTGSKYLLTANGKRILIDCGLFQGLKQLRLRNWAPLPFDVHSVDAVVLTHAHIDHSGCLPLLSRAGYRGPVYCTAATRELAGILLPDAAHLQEEDANFANRHGFSKHSPALPLYTLEDAKAALRLLKPVEFDRALQLAPELSVQWHRAGHILGSAWLSFQIGDARLLFSGDLGRPQDAIMKPPASVVDADWMVVESTYGDRRHDAIDPAEAMLQAIGPTLSRGGVVVIPAFAVGRAQTVLYYLYQLLQSRKLAKVPIYLNSPMAADATRLFQAHRDEHRLAREVYAAMCHMVRVVNTPEESRHLNTLSGPMIIVSASGMATGGRVLHHIRQFGPDEKNTILFVGFQAAGTRGARMLEGVTEVKMFGEYVPIRARVAALDCLSSDGDYHEIVDWLRGARKPPQRCFITHGEPGAADAMRLQIQEALHWAAEVPAHGDVIRLR
jgi:metallo-beta-lactamase family protein